MSHSIYEARWNYALKIAHKINKYLNSGYLVYDDTKCQILAISITEKKIIAIYEGFKCILFLKDKDWDEGLYTPIYKAKENYEKWTILNPKYIRSLTGGKKRGSI